MSRSGLEATLLRELARTWKHLNNLLFSQGLRSPAFTLTEGQAKLGEWRPRDRTIALSRALVTEHPWAVVIEVLKHEMAHQYVTEVIKPLGEGPHGPAFRRICARLGLDPMSRGLPSATPLDPVRERALGKVQRLLALAESDNVHEAEAAMARAHALMRKHNIAWAEEGPASTYVFRQVGPVRARVPAHERILAGLVARHFFVEAIWIWVFDPQRNRDAKALELSGTPENVALAEYVHAFLLRTTERLWLREPAQGARARGRFMSGVVMGFDEKLQAQATACEQEEGLVWLGDSGLDDYVGRRHPRLRRVRRTQVIADDAWARGRQAGMDIVLHKPVDQAPSARGRQLTSSS